MLLHGNIFCNYLVYYAYYTPRSVHKLLLISRASYSEPTLTTAVAGSSTSVQTYRLSLLLGPHLLSAGKGRCLSLPAGKIVESVAVVAPNIRTEMP
jgi:hypothetical protein